MNNYFSKREVCPVCNSDSIHVVYNSSYDNPEIYNYLVKFYSSQGNIDYSYLKAAPYILCECNICTLIFQQYIPDERLMHLLYEKWIDPERNYKFHQESDGLALFSDYAIELMRIISSLNKSPSELDFLDFGMGWGKWSVMAKAFGVNSYGLEFAERKNENAAMLGIGIVNITNLKEHQFDFINTEQVFEHLVNPQETLEILVHSLKHGGVIKISVPNGDNFKHKYAKMDWSKNRFEKNSLQIVSPLEHINLFTTKSLNTLANNHGLKPYYISIKKQFKYSLNMKPFYPMINNLILPIKRNILKQETYCFFKKC